MQRNSFISYVAVVVPLTSCVLKASLGITHADIAQKPPPTLAGSVNCVIYLSMICASRSELCVVKWF